MRRRSRAPRARRRPRTAAIAVALAAFAAGAGAPIAVGESVQPELGLPATQVMVFGASPQTGNAGEV
jgi:hypothetical protein